MHDIISREAPPGGVPYLLKMPQAPMKGIALLLHGYSGDERVMWSLEHTLPPGMLIASLRGVHPAAFGGYQWVSTPAGIDAEMIDFRDSVRAIQAIERDIFATYATSDTSRRFFIGFSQGAALAFAAVADGGMEASGVVALAGFLPYGDLSAFTGQSVFWGHGTRDDFVPIDRARADVLRLEGADARVHFCEASVGHKLGVECTKGLENWLLEMLSDEL